MEVFFQGLKPAQRVEMAQNIARYDDPLMPKLIGKCLGTFDAAARKALTDSMAKLAKTQPKAVAEQMALNGSFQQLAVATALREAGPSVIPLVVDRLTNADARPKAVAFLVESGPAAVPPLVQMLDHKEKDVRLAAADALGKLRARAATAKLVQMYRGSQGDEKFGYLGAIAGIGDPATESLLADALNNTNYPASERAQAALGLGRIGSTSAIELLWKYPNRSTELGLSAISALQIVGDPALDSSAPEEERLLVAEGIHSPKADQVIVAGLSDPKLLPLAASLAKRRPSVVAELASALAHLDASVQGDTADALILALSTTDQGLAKLKTLTQPELKGLIDRRLELQHISAS
jgi:HEAT repeat protein